MKIYHQILSCLLLLAISIKEGLSLKCHTCNNFNSTDCNTVTDATLTECNANQTVCRKVEQHINYNKQDHIRIFRQCATLGTPGSCESRIGTYRFKSWYCHCKGDGCNGSGSLLASITLTATLIAAYFEIKKHL